MKPIQSIAVMLIAGLSSLATPQAQAGEQVIVVELFTSQGCSSCPPADALLGELAEMEGVLPLALHVDYWDYIGWKDNFAAPEYTARQKRYAHAAGKRMIYTPQIVIAGEAHVVGNRKNEVMDALYAQMERDAAVTLDMTRSGNAVTISLAAVDTVSGDMMINLVRYKVSETVEIGRGENAGKTITYHHIVQEWQTIGAWDGVEQDLTAEVSSEGPVVAFVQAEGYGAILGAAVLR